MMKENDLAILREMQQELVDHSIESLGEVVKRLLRLRDRLNFKDHNWYNEFTQHVATLDSASTFHPANGFEKSHLESAIKQAVHQLTNLIDVKIC